MNFGRVGFVMEGDWSAAVTYDTLSVVLYEGAVYAAKRMSAGSEPSTHPADWLKWVESPVVSAEQTENGYDLTISNGDGTTSVVHLLNGQITEAELTTALSGLREAFNANIAEGYSSSSVYSEGDYCLYNNVLYRCKADILSPEAWDSTHWEAASLADDVQDLSEDLYSNKVDAITSTASGEIVTIEDGADGLPIKDMTVSLLPVQDLHGQSAPYPAGGGVNKFGDYTVLNAYINGSGAIKSSGNDRAYIIPIKASTGYALKVVRTKLAPDSNNDDVQIGEYYGSDRPVIDEVGALLYSHGYVNDLITATFSTSENAKWLAIKFGNVTKTNIEATLQTIQLEVGSSVSPTYSPYSNVCPISGWTGVDVYQKGFNVWDEEWEVGNIDTSTGENTSATDRIRSKNYIPCIAGATYFFKVPSFTGAYFNRVFFYDANGGYISYVQEYISTAGFTFTVPSNCAYMKFRLSAQYGTTYNHDICINLSGSRNGEYEAYKGKPAIPISWQSSAGTIYGGTLDVTTGKLVAKYVKQTVTSINGVTAADGYGASTIGSYGSVVGTVNDPFACSNLLQRTTGSASAMGLGYFSVFNSSGNNDARIAIKLDVEYGSTTAETKTAYNAKLAEWNNAGNPLEITYQLTEGTEYQLTPTQIATLLGTNNFWSNGNGSIDLEYRCDTKLYIENLTKPSEDDMTANANIANGKFFMVGNRLFLSTTAIAQGETITPGTNCTEVSLADALNQINA